jgi:excinuclease ABC subunit C
MQGYAEALKFEEAQTLKSRIETIERYQAKSAVVSSTVNDVDVISLLHDPKVVYVNYLVIHNGAITNGMTVEVTKKLEETDDDIIGFVLAEMRQRFNSQSKEVIVAALPTLEIDGISFHVPQRGDKRTLLELSERNVKFYRLEKRKQEKLKNPERHTERILETIKKDFRLLDLPVHIECFDNSNFHGTHAVAACVVFKNGKPSKKDYRHFNIKTVEGSDDFASMEEVVYRRYKRLLEEKQPLPQLIVIDGGKGQLSSALKALDKLEIRGKIAIVGIAKKLEEIFFPGDQLPLYIDKKSESLRVIQYLRNEAHRFGITHHRNKRSKASIVSELTEIKGVGEKTYEELIRHFKSVSRVKSASLDDISEIIGSHKAKVVFNHFHAE